MAELGEMADEWGLGIRQARACRGRGNGEAGKS